MFKNTSSTSWLSAIKSKLEYWYTSLNLNFNTIIQLSSYCIGGFIVGFLGKRYFKFLMLLIIFSALLMWALQYVGVITFDFVKLKALLGIMPTDTFDTTIRMWLEWIKNHFLISLSVIIGFFIGFILG